MKRKIQICVAIFLFVAASLAFAGDAPGRWTKEQAAAWAKDHGWLVGCNFLPSTAVNSLEMFQADTFDPATIDRELGWAESLGYNSVRIFLNSLLWQQDEKGFLERLDKFLAIADKHHIRAAFVLFDSCWDPEPKLGKQPDPIPRVHNSRWVQSPGSWALKDPAKREALKDYVQGVVGRFRDDRRVQWWDLWNEPDQADSGPDAKRIMSRDEKLNLVILTLEKAFAWAREAKPSQPLTSGILGGPWKNLDKLSPLQRLQVENSDIVSFHCYEPIASVKACVESLRPLGRPVLCTEFMARTEGSTFDPILGYFREQGVAAYSAALVEGKINCKFPWDSLNGRKYDAEPNPWFHDVFHQDGRPYDAKEVEYIRRVTGARSTSDGATDGPGRWTKEQADAWAKQRGWLVGCNFLPSTAVNSIEMFQAESFDPETIDRELGWAESIGFNSVRIFLNSLIWEHDGKGYLERLDKFLAIANKHHIGAIFVLFDSCWDPEPKLGKQLDPIPRMHNSRWVQSPGSWALKDPAKREVLKQYVHGIVGRYRDDRRVQAWDMWNEPGEADWGPNAKRPMDRQEKVKLVTETLEKAFAWAREAKPSQPLTTGLLGGPWNDLTKLSPLLRLQIENSDVLSFHCYEPLDAVKARVESLRPLGRPILCTEFMARTQGSTFDPILKYFHDEGVGANAAALVEGRIQTKYPTNSLLGVKYPEEPSPWYHDIFRKDGRPYDEREVEYIRSLTGAKR